MAELLCVRTTGQLKIKGNMMLAQKLSVLTAKAGKL